MNHFQSNIKRTYLTRFRECFNKYLINTTLHGLKYIGDRTISKYERGFFILMFLIVATMSAFFIGNVWRRWNTSPIIVVLDAKGTSIRSIPFPAVSICNMNQALKSVASKIPRTSEEYAILQSICRFSVDKNVTNSMVGTWDTFRKVLLSVAPPCERMLVACRYGGKDVDCMKIFNPILTDAGICCIFNGVHRKFMFFRYNRSENFRDDEYMEMMANNWTPETGFHSDELKNHEDGYPRPGSGSGNHVGLSILLNTTVNEYYCSSTNGCGFKVLLHSPNELPPINNYALGIANGYESSIIATPVLSSASKAIRNMAVNIRDCLFEDENLSSLYRIYSRTNCQQECETNIYHKHCNCVLYSMPRRHHNISICGQSDAKCTDHVKQALRSRKNASFDCNCLYGCHGIKYEMALSTTPIFHQAPALTRFNVSAEDVAILHVYYESLIVWSQKKELLIGLTEFLSNIGGLLGLFMGFSAFSIIELFYFFMVRPYCTRFHRTDDHQPVFKPFGLNKTINNHSTNNMNYVVVNHIN